MMNDDPIVSEIRRIREAYAAEFGFDLDRIVKDLRRRQKESGRRAVSFPPKRIEAEDSRKKRAS